MIRLSFILKTYSIILRSSGSSPATAVRKIVEANLYALMIANKGSFVLIEVFFYVFLV